MKISFKHITAIQRAIKLRLLFVSLRDIITTAKREEKIIKNIIPFMIFSIEERPGGKKIHKLRIYRIFLPFFFEKLIRDSRKFRAAKTRQIVLRIVEIYRIKKESYFINIAEYSLIVLAGVSALLAKQFSFHAV